MQSKFLKSLGVAVLMTASPFALMAQTAPPPADPMPPMNSEQQMPPSGPPQPGEPMPSPSPTDPTTPPMPRDPMGPMSQPSAQGSSMEMPMQGSTNAPMGPMATPPGSGSDMAQSGGTTSSMMTPQPATKEYPPCSRTVQDSCRNVGEGPRRAKKPR